MKLNLHFLQAEGSLTPWRDVLRLRSNSVAERISKIVPSEFGRHEVDVVIQHLPDETVPELGIGGSCFRRGLVTISLDPGARGFEDHLTSGVFDRTLAHELHHAMRWRTSGYGLSLGDALVSEGLADVFSEMVSGISAPPWTSALTENDLSLVLDRAEDEINSFHYDHATWFFGTGDLPRWAGYSIGYRLVRLFTQENPDISANGLVDAPSALFLAAWTKLKNQRACLPIQTP